MKIERILLFVIAALLLMTPPIWCESDGPLQPSKKDKCPVCGMFVYKYPDWMAGIVFKDGTTDYFDGSKDLFKYYLNIKKYRPGKSKKDIKALYVKEYYEMKPIDAETAFFVLGGDVYGPMGHELVPFATEEDAKNFMTDHKGERLLRFGDITAAVLGNLD